MTCATALPWRLRSSATASSATCCSFQMSPPARPPSVSQSPTRIGGSGGSSSSRRSLSVDGTGRTAASASCVRVLSRSSVNLPSRASPTGYPSTWIRRRSTSHSSSASISRSSTGGSLGPRGARTRSRDASRRLPFQLPFASTTVPTRTSSSDPSLWSRRWIDASGVRAIISPPTTSTRRSASSATTGPSIFAPRSGSRSRIRRASIHPSRRSVPLTSTRVVGWAAAMRTVAGSRMIAAPISSAQVVQLEGPRSPGA
jgi:hypothetical protein